MALGEGFCTTVVHPFGLRALRQQSEPCQRQAEGKRCVKRNFHFTMRFNEIYTKGAVLSFSAYFDA
ncbi:hypothetical protein C1N72_20285 [Pantoea ananatis]